MALPSWPDATGNGSTPSRIVLANENFINFAGVMTVDGMRGYPARKDRPVTFALPPIDSARDAADLIAAVAEAVAIGHITPTEATEIAKVIDAYVKACQAAKGDERGAH